MDGDPVQIDQSALTGESLPVTRKSGNPIGGIKVVAANGWFATRPSGTEAIYKIYAESFRGEAHLTLIETEAQTIANQAFASAASAAMTPELQETK